MPSWGEGVAVTGEHGHGQRQKSGWGGEDGGRHRCGGQRRGQGRGEEEKQYLSHRRGGPRRIGGWRAAAGAAMVGTGGP